MGFPTYGAWPFEKIGLHTSVPLLGRLRGCVHRRVGCGWHLVEGPAGELVAALALLPFELFYWIGFDLPFGHIAGLARTVLVIIAMRG